MKLFFCFIRPRSRSCGSRVSNVGRDSVELVESSLRYMLNTHTVEWHKKLNFSRKNVAYRHLPIYHIVRYIAIHEKRDFDGWKMLINFIMEIFFIPLHLMMLWICLLCSSFYQHIQQCVTRQVWSNVSGNEFIERRKKSQKTVNIKFYMRIAMELWTDEHFRFQPLKFCWISNSFYL